MIGGLTYLSDNWRYDETDETIRDDFSRFSRDGINVICLLTHWQNLEPSKDNYDKTIFTNLKRVTDIAKEYDIYVIHNIHTTYKGNDVPNYIGSFKNLFPGYQDYSGVGYTVGDWRTKRDSWIKFLKKWATELDIVNVIGFQFGNEWVNLNWKPINWYVGVDAYNELILESVTALREVTSIPLSLRLAVNSSYSGFNEETLKMLDFASFNYYTESHNENNLRYAVSEAHRLDLPVWMTEFGSKETLESGQEADIRSYLELFEQLGVDGTTVWWYCPYDGPSSPEYNINDYNLNQPKPAYYAVVEYNEPYGGETEKLSVPVINEKDTPYNLLIKKVTISYRSIVVPPGVSSVTLNEDEMIVVAEAL